jgi:hypothetical protein
MDTMWFAVDADGHVGYFSPGEGGAVPASADRPDPDDVQQRLTELIAPCETHYDLRGFLAPGPRRERSRHRSRPIAGDGLLFLRSLDPVRQYHSMGNVQVVAAGTDIAIQCCPLPKDVFRRLHTDGHCLGCFDLSAFDVGWDGVAKRGVYCYTHPTYFDGDRSEDNITGPYGRAMVPGVPLHIDQLPPSLREAVSRIRFDGLRFAETVHIQPCELGPVECDNAAYLTVDGRTIRPIEGRYPDAYRQFHEWLTNKKRDWLQGITVEPPRRPGPAKG